MKNKIYPIIHNSRECVVPTLQSLRNNFMPIDHLNPTITQGFVIFCCFHGRPLPLSRPGERFFN